MTTRIKELFRRIMSSDIGRRMATGAFWSFAGTGLAKAIVLLSSIVCAHILTKEQYGQFGIVRSTINLFVVVGSAGLGVTATKHIAQYLRSEKEKISGIYVVTNSFAFITGLIVTAAILIAAPYLATHSLNSPDLVVPVRVGALLLFVTVINGAQQGTLNGFEDFKSVAINNFFGSLCESVLMLVGAYYAGVMGAILGYGTGYVVLYILNQIAIRRNLRRNGIEIHRRQISWQDTKVLYKFSLPVFFSGLLVTPVYWVVRTMLVQHADFEELAVYEASEQWRMIILFIPTAVSSVVLPILSSLHKSSVNDYKKVLRRNLMLNAGIALAIASVVVIVSPWIMGAYGKDYGNSTLTLNILACSTIFQTMANVVGLSIWSRSKVWHGFGFNLFWSAMMIIFTHIFLNMNLGASAIALATLISYVIHTTAQLTYLSYHLRHSFA